MIKKSGSFGDIVTYRFDESIMSGKWREFFLWLDAPSYYAIAFSCPLSDHLNAVKSDFYICPMSGHFWRPSHGQSGSWFQFMSQYMNRIDGGRFVNAFLAGEPQRVLLVINIHS